MTTREQAMQWKNSLDIDEQIDLCIKYNDICNLQGRLMTNLTGSEIEKIWQKETKTTENIYLNRLKEQYYEVRRCLFPNEADYVRARYGGMREFCLDTQLVSFNDIEVMESEVNQSF